HIGRQSVRWDAQGARGGWEVDETDEIYGTERTEDGVFLSRLILGEAAGEAPGGGEGVDFGGGFVFADADDSGEAHGEAAVVARAGLEEVEGDFEDGVGLDLVEAAVLADGAF